MAVTDSIPDFEDGLDVARWLDEHTSRRTEILCKSDLNNLIFEVETTGTDSTEYELHVTLDSTNPNTSSVVLYDVDEHETVYES